MKNTQAKKLNWGRLCDGHCAKDECVCPQSTPPQNTDWEERFNEKFPRLISTIILNVFKKPSTSSLKMMKQSDVTEDVKVFIQSEKDLSYQQGRESMRREILECLPKKVLVGEASDYLEGGNYGFNQALSQVEKVIKEIK